MGKFFGNLFLMAFVALIAIGIFSEPDRDEQGEIVDEGNLSAFALRLGDCFNDPKEKVNPDTGIAEVEQVRAIPCANPHHNEVFALFNIQLDAFPGTEQVSSIASENCLSHFNEYVGKDYKESALDFYSLLPTQQSWNDRGDKEVICVVHKMSGEKTAGSLKNSGL